MNFEFDNDRPIYKQLIDQIKFGIITGIYVLGEKLPSVRDLSFKIKVNPNTIQRALSELESNNLIITKRTSGKFVTNNATVINKLKKELSKKYVDKFTEKMDSLMISTEEITSLIKEKRKEK
ncbi:MAG: GntR family transcriptional regulator [Bacilli bacterium]